MYMVYTYNVFLTVLIYKRESYNIYKQHNRPLRRRNAVGDHTIDIASILKLIKALEDRSCDNST